MPDPDPLILTLAFDAPTFARFQALRQRHFPAKLNRIPAHATLFHHLPGDEEPEILRVLRAETAREPSPEVKVTGTRFIGRGVAYTLESPALGALRSRVAKAFSGALTAQDQQGWRPHVTVQNKVDPGEARALHAALQAEFSPFRFRAPGLLLWRYKGGPWEALAEMPFADGAGTDAPLPSGREA